MAENAIFFFKKLFSIVSSENDLGVPEIFDDIIYCRRNIIVVTLRWK